MPVIQPVGGYDFPQKRNYRRHIWNEFREWTSPRTFEAKAVLMPSKDGDELDLALDKRFRIQNIAVIDKNPAIVAKLRIKYPALMATKGCLVSEAGKRLVKEGVSGLHVANLDFTGTVHTVCDEVAAFVESGVMAPASLISVTVMKGREIPEAFQRVKEAAAVTGSFHTEARDILEEYADKINDAGGSVSQEKLRARNDSWAKPTFAGRITLLGHAISYGGLERQYPHIFNIPRFAMVRDSGEYRSGTKRMLWVIFKVHNQPCFCDVCLLNMLALIRRNGGAHFKDIHDVLDAQMQFHGIQNKRELTDMMKERMQHIGYSTPKNWM